MDDERDLMTDEDADKLRDLIMAYAALPLVKDTQRQRIEAMTAIFDHVHNLIRGGN